jgi:hypothetical protein
MKYVFVFRVEGRASLETDLNQEVSDRLSDLHFSPGDDDMERFLLTVSEFSSDCTSLSLRIDVGLHRYSN